MMKLNCNIEVVNRSVGHVSHKKSQKSSLAIGKQSNKNPEIYFLLQSVKNQQGTKYKINGNIEIVFSTCVKDGKATIRLREPPHDIVIKSSKSAELQVFLRSLKSVIGKEIIPPLLSQSKFNLKPLLQPPKTKITIKTKSDYPVLQGFSRTTEELDISGLDRKSFDRGILRLQSLRVLNLSNNKFKSLPKELGNFQHLTELILSNNLLGCGEINKWSWLSGKNLSNNLKLLNLNGNQLEFLPNQIGKLASLVTLNVSDNQLKSLPLSVGILPKLKYLDVSKNKIAALPGSMKSLRLMSINVSDNLFNSDSKTSCQIGVPSLKEISSRVVLKHRMMYDASIVPFTLVNFLDNASFCVCRTACFNTFFRQIMYMNLKRISTSVTSSGITIVPFDCIFCSVNCVNKYRSEFY